jgi:glyceraldehyde 3-phosphate dehydrogenase
MSVRVAINGFGRIGRLVMRAGLHSKDVEFVAVNDIAEAKTLAHLLKYDSVHGTMQADVKASGDAIVIDGHEVKAFAIREPENLPWKDLGIDVVLESTGKFTDRAGAERHMKAGAKKVVISAPAKNPDVTFVLGVNQEVYNKAQHHVISMGSCTTNCLAPVAKILQNEYGIEYALMTTIHAFTNDQVVLDEPHKDLRRARAASLSMIPTTTGAARALAEVIPELKGRMDGMSIRVPTPTVSLVDLVAKLSKPTSKDELNGKFKEYAAGPLKGILAWSDEELVSVDFKGNPNSSIVDLPNTTVIGGNLVKILSWYDNEWGFSNRMLELLSFIMK